MKTEIFTAKGRTATVYMAESANCPLIVLNTYKGDGRSVVDTIREIDEHSFNLVCIGDLKWDHDMTPWYCPPLSADDTPCTGGADDYLALLTEKILPHTLEMIHGTPAHIGIAGYSLAGLFAVYALHKTDVFDRAASMSGSFWFPDFKDYVLSHEMKRQPEKMYISLGDKEAKVRHHLLRTVRDHTEAIVEYLRQQGIDVTWELNPGNHYQDAAMRSAKGIAAIL